MIQAIFYDNNLDYEHKNEEKNTRKCLLSINEWKNMYTSSPNMWKSVICDENTELLWIGYVNSSTLNQLIY